MLLRKIRIDRWPEEYEETLNVDDIPADPITRDMNAASNTFSVWDFDESNLIEGALTISLNDSSQKLDTIDIVYFDKKDLELVELDLNNDKPGNTSYKKFEKNHYDIVNMNHKAIGKVAKIIIKSIGSEKYETVSKDDLISAAVERIKKGDLKLEDLNKKLREQLSAHLA